MLSSAGLKFNSKTLGSSRAGKGIQELGNSGNSALELDLGKRVGSGREEIQMGFWEEIIPEIWRISQTGLGNFQEFHPTPKIPFKSDFSLCPVPASQIPPLEFPFSRRTFPAIPEGFLWNNLWEWILNRDFGIKSQLDLGSWENSQRNFWNCGGTQIHFQGFSPDLLEPKKIFPWILFGVMKPELIFMDFS